MGTKLTVLLVLTTVCGAAAAAGQPPHDGLVWIFYDDAGMSRPNSMGTDSRIDLDTGTTIHDFSRVWVGYVIAPIEGDVTFSAEADDGLRLSLGGHTVIDGWGGGTPREGVYAFSSPGDAVPLRVDYYQQGGEGHMRLYWSWSGHSRELVPPEAFRHDDTDLETAKTVMENVPMRAEDTPLTESGARLYAPGGTPPAAEPIALARGPHLLIDDYFIASSERVRRVVNSPEQDAAIPNPVVTGKEDGCFQPYMTIVRDPESGRFRMWYGRYADPQNHTRSRIGYIESSDGIHWDRPARTLEDPAPIQFGVSVIDEGPDFDDPARRFKYAWHMDGGLKVATSPDAIVWTPMTPAPVIYQNHDINGIFRDDVRGCYTATLSVYRGGPWEGKRRITMQSSSTDLLNWDTPHYVVLPDLDVDPGVTQFYAMDGYLARGELIVGMVKVLRDDLKADTPPDPPEAYGVGYTALAWSRDGKTWTRDPAHFFDPHPEKGVWDHAHAWIDDQVMVGDEVYLYYGGYARGHKVNRFEERQIGLVTMKRDRYVAREAGAEAGVIRTPLLRLEGDTLTVNADCEGGTLQVQVTDESGTPLPGLTFDACTPIAADGLDLPVRWKAALSSVIDKPVRIEFRLRNARLFAFAIE